MTANHHRQSVSSSSAWSSSTTIQDMELRQRDVGPRSSRDLESSSPPPQKSPEEVHLRRIATLCMRLDLQAAHTVTEDWSHETRLSNAEPHFSYLWSGIRPGSAASTSPFAPPPMANIMAWLEADGEARFQALDDYAAPPGGLAGFAEYVALLPAAQLRALVADRAEAASPFYVRLLVGRLWKLQEQRTIKGLAERDLRGCCEINLGLLIGERAADERDYLQRLTRKHFMARARLTKALAEARLLRDAVTDAFRVGALDEELLPGLRLRVKALQEYHDEACRLLEERHGEALVDHTCEDWFIPGHAGPHRTRIRRVSNVTLACLTLLFSLVAGYPASIGFASAPASAGSWSDSDFWCLLGAVILQLLNLATQLIGPHVFERLKHARVVGDTESLVWTWLIAVLAVLCTSGSVASYGLLSVQFSGWLAFAAQVFSSMVQLILVFRE